MLLVSLGFYPPEHLHVLAVVGQELREGSRRQHVPNDLPVVRSYLLLLSFRLWRPLLSVCVEPPLGWFVGTIVEGER
jgi:hypothetical protein